ncbi:restriction endonuclease subunit S [uncultured Megamonas sp.]|uniref:restriction endonuclease subunit S n=1 Tax=uncultured Megamonas sp. TaxID=286140 RepID=UPI002597A12E|nr:restriction endonuclease subunit S [uncultured Megamonas sp.]
MAKKKQIELTIEEKLQNALVPKEEQPYKIPSNWCWTYIHNIAIVVTGKTPSKKNKEYYGGKFPFFKPADLDAGRNMQYATEYLSEKGKSISVIIPEKATGICCIGTIGKCGYFLVEGTTNQQINTVISKINPLYSYYFFNTNSFVRELISKASATTIAIVNKSKLESCLFPVAPLNEQQRIVNRIESLFVKLDRAKELIENTLAQFKQNKMAILHKAFTGELTAKWRKENNIDLSSWKKCELKEVFKVVKDKYNPQTENQIVNYIGLENIETSKGIISKSNSSEVKSIKTKFKKDDVLYGKLRPYLNKHDVVNFDGICSTDILVFRFNDINTAKYINYYFNLPMFIQYAVENSSGINLPRVSEKTISKYKISLPTLEEQQEIVNILDKLLAKYNKIKNLEQQLEKIELLKKAILAKAFRGELGTNNPDEESAENLLKEILAEK